MVASAVGLIVISGISQLVVNMSSRLNNLEESSAKNFFNKQIGQDLKNNCKETFSHVKLQSDNTVSVISKLLEGEEVKFTKILRDDGDPDTESTNVIIDLSKSSEKEKLSAQYGMAGDLHFLLRCSEEDCNCSTFPCSKSWAFTFISQSRQKSFLRYVKNTSLYLRITFTQGGTNPKLECDVKGFDTASILKCFKIGYTGPTLAGCGSTMEILDTNNTTTAFGYNAGSLGSIGRNNVFLGYEAGYKNTTGEDNTFIGYQAGFGASKDAGDNYIPQTGEDNTFLGYQAGYKNTTGDNNVFLGNYAGAGSYRYYDSDSDKYIYIPQTGANNVFLGVYAGYRNTTGGNNTFLGTQSGSFNTAGNSNTFLGLSAGSRNTTGEDNTFIGHQAGFGGSKDAGYNYIPQTGDNNVFLGRLAGYRNTTGSGNIFIGEQAGNNVYYEEKSNYFVIGNNKDNNRWNRIWIRGEIGTEFLVVKSRQVCLENKSGSCFSCIKVVDTGHTLMGCRTTTDNPNNTTTVFGYNAGSSKSIGDHNTFLGGIGSYNTTGESNTFIGGVGRNKTGSFNTYIFGRNGGYGGDNNVFVVSRVRGWNSYDNNTSIGFGGNVSGDNNVFVSNMHRYTNYFNIGGRKNTFLGYQVGSGNEGDNNTFLGYQAGRGNEGDNNTFIGSNAGFGGARIETIKGGYVYTRHILHTGNSNTFIGDQAGTNNTEGNNNTFIGTSAGYSNSFTLLTDIDGVIRNYILHTGNNNTFIGYQSGCWNQTGSFNTSIGSCSTFFNSPTTTGNQNIFIGYRAGDGFTLSNRLVIGNSKNTASRTWIEGVIGESSLKVNGQEIVNSSSRTLKKNIRPFKNFEKALEDILKTPLFTFEYKKDNPEKSRMGIISEELPKHLQLFNDSNVSYPDRPGIYGTFWASLKALYFKIQDLKQVFADFQQTFTDFKEQSHKSLSLLNKENEDFKTELKASQQKFVKEILETQKELVKTQKEFSRREQEFSQIKKEFYKIKKESPKINKKLFSTKRGLAQTQKKLLKLKSM